MGVSLRGTGFSFLCGNGVYLDLLTLWRGSCTIIAAVPEATIMTTEDLASSGGIPNLGSFLEEAIRPVRETQKRTTDCGGHAYNPILDRPEIIHSIFRGLSWFAGIPLREECSPSHHHGPGTLEGYGSSH